VLVVPSHLFIYIRVENLNGSPLCSDTMKIFYRISDKGRRDEKPDYINLRSCLSNFCQHFAVEDITVIADNCEPETLEFIRSRIPRNNVHATSLGNAGSFMLALKKGAELSCDENTIVYMVEDDYIHAENSCRILKEGFQHGDYVSLYDHPDKYMSDYPNPYVKDGGENTKVFLTKSTHWKLTNSTPMTFASKIKTIRRDFELISSYCTGKTTQSFLMFCDLIQNKKRKLVTPIPGRATHGQLPWLGPLVDWKAQTSTGPLAHESRPAPAHGPPHEDHERAHLRAVVEQHERLRGH